MGEKQPRGEEVKIEQKGPLSDVEQLIAEANAAAAETQRAAAAGEIQTAQAKKKASAETVERLQEQEVFFTGLKADDAFVEDYAYEWILGAYEENTGIAAPEKINEAIDGLRKTGEALRTLASVEPKAEALIKKMEALQKMHDKLFEIVHKATLEALDKMKKKHKGEETDFEKRYRQLTESSLVRGIEYDDKSPEVREKALKQEIEEVMMRPFVDGPIKSFQQQVEEKKKLIAEAEKIQRSIDKDQGSGKNPSWTEVNQIKNLLTQLTGQGGVTESQASRVIRNQEDILEKMERQERDDSVVIEVNRTIIQTTLGEEHDEKALQEALVELKNLLSSFREEASQGYFERSQVDTHLRGTLAQKLLGRYTVYGVTRTRINMGLDEKVVPDLFPASQLLSYVKASNRETLSRRGAYSWQAAKADGVGAADFIGDYVGEVPAVKNPEEVQKEYLKMQNRVARGPGEDVEKKAEYESVKKIIAKYPDEKAFLEAVFAGEGYYMNLRRASQKVRGVKARGEEESKPLPKELEKIGWKESKLGAFVEPGQDMKKIDRDYARLLEQLSKSQLEAEKAFDLRGPDGEFHVYTTDQAVNLLRRARRDARDIVLRSDKIVEKKHQEVGGLSAQIEGLNRRNKQLEDDLALQIKLRINDNEDSKKEQNLLGKRLDEERDSRQRFEKAHGRATQKNVQAEKSLEEALKTKSGFLGGEKALRRAVEAAIEQLKEK